MLGRITAPTIQRSSRRVLLPPSGYFLAIVDPAISIFSGDCCSHHPRIFRLLPPPSGYFLPQCCFYDLDILRETPTPPHPDLLQKIAVHTIQMFLGECCSYHPYSMEKSSAFTIKIVSNRVLLSPFK
jgi:hypothetical protein